MNPWQNMRRLFHYILWSYLSSFQQLLFEHVLTVQSESCGSLNGSGQPIIEFLPTKYTWNSSFSEVSHGFKDVKIVTDPCDRGKAAYAAISGNYSGKVLVTSDIIRKNFQILFLRSSLVQGRPVLTSLVFVRDGLLTVINNELILFDIYTLHASKTRGIQVTDRVDTVNTHTCCLHRLSWCKAWSDTVLAYRQTSTSQVYFSTNGGKHFEICHLNFTTIQFNILSSTVLGRDLTAVFLAQDLSTSKFKLICLPITPHRRFLMFNETKRLYTVPLPELENTADSRHIGMSQLFSYYNSLLLWDHKKLVYKPQLDLNGVEVLIHQTLSTPFLSAQEYIRHIHSNSLGEFIVITSYNRLLYGKESIKTEATVVTSLTSAIMESVVAIFVNTEDLLLIRPIEVNSSKDNTLLQVDKLYLPDEISLLKDVLPQCPYEYILFNGFNSHYRLDINDKIEFSTKVHPSAWQEVSLVTEISVSRSLMLTTTILELSAEPGVIDLNMTTSASITPLSYLGHINTEHSLLEDTPTDTELRVLTSTSSLTCRDNSQAIAHVTLGCDGDKRLVVNRAPESCDTLRHQYSYELKPDEYDPHFGINGTNVAADGSKTVEYNFNVFGCANRTYYNTPFLFDLHLYRGSKYLGPMTGDYVIYEVTGATKFAYSRTVNGSGCLFPPQSWKEMRLAAVDGTSSRDIWHRRIIGLTPPTLTMTTRF